MKDENIDLIMDQFVGLKSKMYSTLVKARLDGYSINIGENKGRERLCCTKKITT